MPSLKIWISLTSLENDDLLKEGWVDITFISKGSRGFSTLFIAFCYLNNSQRFFLGLEKEEMVV